MGKVKARIRGHRKLYIHNDLENAAYFTKGVIEEKIRTDQRDGIGFDYIYFCLMQALSFEAKMNFMGARYVKPWDESMSWKKKANKVFKAIGVEVDWNERRYASLERMKKFRDLLAHGKPIEEDVDYEFFGEEGEMRKGLLKHAWENIINHADTMQTYEDIESIWKEMIVKSGIDPNDLLDQGEFNPEILQRF